MQGGVRGVLGCSKEGGQGAERTAAAVSKGKQTRFFSNCWGKATRSGCCSDEQSGIVISRTQGLG